MITYRNARRRARRRAAIVAALVAMQAPAIATSTGPSTPVELTIVGGPDLNPNAQGRPSPVVVRIFELIATTGFEAADYAALYEHPAEALKRDLVTQEELVLRPGEIKRLDRTLPPQVTSLGLAAAFRAIDGTQWHITVPLTPGSLNQLLIDIDAKSIRPVSVDPGRS